MEKNRNRTDLLAAGRKKLLQFQKKKDKKGSGKDGKSSHKTSGTGQESGDGDVAPIDSSVTSSTDTDMSPVDSSVTSSADTDVAPVDSSVTSSADTAVATIEPLVSVKLDDGGSPHAPSAGLVPIDSSVAPLHGDGKGDLSSTVDTLLADRETVASANDDVGPFVSPAPLVVPALAMEVDAELLPVNSLASPSDANMRKGEAGMAHVTDSLGTEEVTLTTVDGEVEPVGSPIAATTVDGDVQLAPVDLLTPPPGKVGGDVIPAEMDRENEEHFPELLMIQPLDGNEKSDMNVLAGPMQEADCSAMVHCHGRGEETHVPLHDDKSLEVGSERPENEKDERFTALQVPDMGSLAEGTHIHATVSVEVTCETDRTDTVIEHGESSQQSLETLSSSQDFVTEQYDEVQLKVEQEGGVEMYKQQQFPMVPVVIETLSIREPLEAAKMSASGGEGISLGENSGFVDFIEPSKVPEVLKEDEVRSLHKSREMDSMEDSRSLVNRVLPEVVIADSLESLKQQLYLTNVAKDFLNMQLTEQTEEQIEFDRRDRLLLDEASELRTIVKTTQETNMNISEELAWCRSQLWAMTSRKEEFETQYLSAREEINELSARAYEFQSKLEQSQEEVTPLLAELAGCKALLGALQMENANLTGNILSLTEEKKKLMEEKEYFINENTKLGVDLLEHKERLMAAHDKQVQHESDLKEEMTSIEQLTEENIYLSSSLELHKEKLKEFFDKYQQLHAEALGVGNQLRDSNVLSVSSEKAIEDSQVNSERCDGTIASGQVEPSIALENLQGSLVLQTERKCFDDSVGLFALKEHLEEAEKMMQKLENAIHGMQSHSVFLSSTGGKMTPSGVSRLIQAFESKVQHDDEISNELPPTEGERSSDNFIVAKEQTSNLRVILKQLDLDAVKANELFMKDQDSTRLFTVSLEELKAEYETQKQRNDDLEVKNDDLIKKLTEYQMRVDQLLNQFDAMQKNADATVCSISNQVEYLQKELHDNTYMLEQERKSLVDAISVAVEKLDKYTVVLFPTSLTAPDNPVVGDHFTVSVDNATKMIQDLHEKLESAYLDNEKVCNSYEELKQKVLDMHGKNEVAVGLVDKIYSSLRKLVSDSCGDVADLVKEAETEELLKFVPSNCEALIGKLEAFLNERQQLQSLNNALEAELMKATQEMEGLNKSCLDLATKMEENEFNAHSEVINKLVEDVEGVIRPEILVTDSDESPVLHLNALVGILVKKYREASEQIHLSMQYLQEYTTRPELPAENMGSLHTLLMEEFRSKSLELSELQDKLNQLESLNCEQEDEIGTLKGCLSKVGESHELAHSELQTKGAELEQSEQRLSSVREKLSIAVSKGKGLIVQRDSLKQSLAEKSNELDKCLQELQSKDAIIHDLEAKLKAFSESGERVEALESELSYIRNSATALRESFLLKDSVLQRIEEILENLELPEQFHCKDIIEKIEWLARSIPRNSLPMTDWDQKSSVGGSYSDGGFVVMDAWKEDLQLNSTPELDDLRRKYDDLQNKFYGLAEHNEMLEQSLVDRNDLIQRWEAVLDRIDMPLQLRSLEPEDRIDWLGRALSESQHERHSLLLKIENLELSYDSLLAELEETQKKLSEFEATLGEVGHEKVLLSDSIEKLRSEHKDISVKAVQYEVEKAAMQKEIADLNEKLVDLQEKVGKYDHFENHIKRLQDLVNDALLDHDLTDISTSGSITDHLEGSLKMIIDKYSALSLEKSVPQVMEKERDAVEADAGIEEQRLKDVLDTKEQELMVIKEQLDGALGNLVIVKEERDKAFEKCKSLVLAVEEISKERDHLQEELVQEEQKSASAREKLNLAVRKGKGLVQQRDSLKQTIQEMNAEIERSQWELNQRNDALVQYEQKIRDLLTLSEKVETLESENVMLRSHLAEAEQNLWGSGQTMSGLLTALHAIDIGEQVDGIDPVQKIERIKKINHDLHVAAVSSDHEAKKSKRAAELLLSELNEVQERSDSLQEELAKAEAAVAGVCKQRDIAESARRETLSYLERFVTQLRKECFDLANLMASVFSKDLELLHNVEAGMQSLLKQLNSSNVFQLSHQQASAGIFPSLPLKVEKFSDNGTLSELKLQDNDVVSEFVALVGNGLQKCMGEIDHLKKMCQGHSHTFDKKAAQLPEVMETIKKGISFQKESSDSLKNDFTHLQLLTNEKDTTIGAMHKNIALLYEACTNSILEIENRKTHNIGNDLASGVHVLGNTGVTLKMSPCTDGQESANGQAFSFSEECIRTVTDHLLSVVKRSADMLEELEEGNQKELKATISHLQKELQEKDIQQNRNYADLVAQIKEAEATANNYLVDLDSAKAQLDQQLEVMKNEHNLLALKVKELQDSEALSKELQERVKSLTDAVNAKDQEIESLMAALDEEDSQMEGMTGRIDELEKIVQQKNLALENLEASRGKAMAKLSTTVSRFNELHHLSENLLSEVKNLESQLQGRDEEISFLRQEVTRCTSDLLASQESNKKNSSELKELLPWLKMLALRFGLQDVDLDEHNGNQIHAYTELLEKHITSVVTELSDLRVAAQSSEALLQAERSKIEELLHKRELLEDSLHEKESQLKLIQGVRDSGQPANVNTPELLEVEPMINKRAVTLGTVAPHVRSVRKVNNDQVAIGIDMESGDNTLDDKDDDKSHDFKSLTMSRIVPRVTRPIADRIDGLWVSGGRVLRRQPTLRLGVLLYWIMLHVLLASSFV